jgi:hypothetical protein
MISYHLIEVLVIGFFVLFFQLPGRKYHFIFLGTLLLATLLEEFRLPRLIRVQGAIYIFYSYAIIGYALIRKKNSSLLLLLGNTIFMSPAMIQLFRINILSKYMLILRSSSNVLLLSCMILAICKRFVWEEKIHERTKWRSHRLENEMLKKSIQPHFIMNTLLSIIQLISKHPRKAIRLIQLLADEFKMVNQFSTKRLISLEEEMKLCRIHLDLMGIRLKNSYQLIQENLNLSDTIPPMVFHTLIENGLTHSLKSDEDGTFYISSHRHGDQTRYIFRNSGSKLIENQNSGPQNVSEGLGIRYVKARLEESYGDHWELKYGVNNSHWEVEICIKN